ncbi:hybrid sensor histidine kinase/response regulator [Sansalvadorimonas verongulae]|uniref:hybrid sensor histidine kinase/response regulator n=1 Tax=Sansalvadorimonas verongulae TaxID=2172824 RepID=UPI0012BD10D5|nr:hybrid sensor histidine kinase/response regulator [Sansalvadorimonas verongulae]MTI13655.1 hybrid sensor histidine kinase/response regulator [Sansalvadorimonas verongulae]
MVESGASQQNDKDRLVKTVINNLPCGVYRFRYFPDDTCKLEYVSEGIQNVLGYSADDLYECPELIWQAIHPDDKDRTYKRMLTNIQEGHPWDSEWRAVLPDGEVRWVREKGSTPKTCSDGSKVWNCILEDVSDRHNQMVSVDDESVQAEQSLYKMLSIIPGLVLQTRHYPDGRITFIYISEAATDLLGVSPQALKQDADLMWNSFHPDDLPELTDSINKSMRSHTDWDHVWRTSHGSVWLHGQGRHFATLADGSILRVGVCTDITREKQLEKNLKDEMMRAEEASIAKSTFLANVSHEMRTPLNGILGYGQLLVHELDLTGQAARNLSSLRQCSNHLLAVINEVLDMAKIESGRLELVINPMALYRLLDEVSSVITPLADSKGLLFRLNTSDDLPGYIKGDATRMRQVLINLLNNAVKFTSDGEVSLKCSMEGEMLRFDIHDTGCGIPQSRIDKIFHPFERMDVHHAVEGTGLGLAITHRIVEALEGTVKLQSTEGVGSCFTIRLPCEEAEAIQEADDKTEFQLRKLTLDPPPELLVVDDRESNRDVMKQWLTLGGFNVVLAANGQEALDQLRKRPCDMVLSDLRMPVMDGMAMIDIIKNDDLLKQIPCVAISASVFPEQIRKVLISGFRAFLPKPCNLNKLFTTIYEILDLNSEAVTKEDKKTTKAREEYRTPFPEQERTTILEMLDMGDIEGLKEHIQQLKNTSGLQAAAHDLSQCLDELDMERFRKVLYEN